MKVVNCTKCNEEFAIDLNKPEEWYCPYCDNLYSVSTDKLSVEKLQEQLNTAKKELTEEIESIEKYLDKYGMSSYGANTRQAYLEGLKKALAAIGNEGSGDE